MVAARAAPNRLEGVMAGTPTSAGHVSSDPDQPALTNLARAAIGHLAIRQYARLSGISAIVFAGLFSAALVLVQQAPGLGVPDSVYTAFYASSSSSVLVAVGLYIAPLAGIAFLWHLAASRAMFTASGEPLSAIPSGLQFASGVAFVAMLFAGTAAAGAIAVLDTLYSADPLPPPDMARALNATGYLMVFIFGVRFAGMYVITTTTLARAAGVLPRWLAIVSYLAAAVLLVSTTNHPAILLVLPAWLLLVSVVVGLHTHRKPSSPEREEAQ